MANLKLLSLLMCYKVSSALILPLLLRIAMTFLLRTHQVLVSLGLFHPLDLFDEENLNICHPLPLYHSRLTAQIIPSQALLKQTNGPRGSQWRDGCEDMWGKEFSRQRKQPLQRS